MLRRYDEATDQWVIEKETYYVSSSVLGAPVSELSSTGVKEKTFVHANGSVLAIQSIQGSTESLEWQHYDPSGASYRGTSVNGAVAIFGAGEMEPLGANAGNFKPITWPQPTSIGKVVPYGGIPDLLSATGGCEIDGMPIQCEILNELKEAGGVANESLINEDGVWKRYRDALQSHGVGLFTTYTYSINEYGEPAADRIVLGSPQKPSRCATFVAGLIGIAANAPPFAGRVNIGRDMLSAVEISLRNNEYPNMPYDGFKEGYIKNQRGWAQAHIMGVAGASLVGNSKVVPIIGTLTGSDLVREQFRQDYADLADAIRKKDQTLINEKHSEINDDYAGVFTGALIDFYIKGTSSYDETRRALFEGLCDY